MVSALFIVSGIALTALILVDVVRTVLSANGAGWTTSHLAHALWSLFLICKPAGRRSRWFSAAGPCLILVVLFTWVVGLWLGLCLFLWSDGGSIIHGSTGAHATLFERAYFAGYTISTLGNGEFEPSGDPWRGLAMFYSISGFGLLTAAISYFVPVLSAVIRQEKLAISISILGTSPPEILRNAPDGESLSLLEAQAPQLQSLIIEHGRSYLAYPIIHYFDGPDPRLSAILNLVILDETLSLLAHAGRSDIIDNSPQLVLLRRSLDSYLRTVRGTIASKDRSENGGFGGYQNQAIASFLDPAKVSTFPDAPDLRERRAILASLLKVHGWNTNDTNHPGSV